MPEMMKKTRTSTTWDDLPDECWEIIFAGLPHHGHHLQVLSLVGKRFLRITNRLHTTITVTLSSPFSSFLDPALLRLFPRFTNLQSLHLSHPHPHLDAFLSHLAASALHLRSLHLSRQTHFPRDAIRLLGRSTIRNTLRTLSCTRFTTMADDDLFVLADCFSYLHTLNIYYLYQDHNCIPRKTMITDQGICAISIRLASLRSFTFVGTDSLSEQSVGYLSSHCPLLSDFKANAISVFLHSFSSFSFLSTLDLYYVKVSEAGLALLAKANLKIWKLVLRSPDCGGVRGEAMCRFLRSLRSLTHLKLKFAHFLNYKMPSDFATSIPYIQEIQLCNVSSPRTLLFDLLCNCPNLVEIISIMNYVELVEYPPDKTPAHHRLRSLVLTGWGLSDEILVAVAAICRNLESLYVMDVPEITDQVMQAIKRSCPNIQICERLNMSVWGKKAIQSMFFVS